MKAFVFPGQGSQHTGMGRDLYESNPLAKELFDKVVAMGCDVIQGYYYARAISLEEFKVFINTNTSIKYKSLVK